MKMNYRSCVIIISREGYEKEGSGGHKYENTSKLLKFLVGFLFFSSSSK